jgi:hypothetical protein
MLRSRTMESQFKCLAGESGFCLRPPVGAAKTGDGGADETFTKAVNANEKELDPLWPRSGRKLRGAVWQQFCLYASVRGELLPLSDRDLIASFHRIPWCEQCAFPDENADSVAGYRLVKRRLNGLFTHAHFPRRPGPESSSYVCHLLCACRVPPPDKLFRATVRDATLCRISPPASLSTSKKHAGTVANQAGARLLLMLISCASSFHDAKSSQKHQAS